jgi:hypothetical protein
MRVGALSAQVSGLNVAQENVSEQTEGVMKIGLIRVVSKVMLLVFAVLSTAAVAQAPVTVNGTVNGNGGPKQFANVKLDGPGHYIATTDPEGRFTIEGVVPGRYTVEVRKDDRRNVFTRNVGRGPLDLRVKW